MSIPIRALAPTQQGQPIATVAAQIPGPPDREDIHEQQRQYQLLPCRIVALHQARHYTFCYDLIQHLDQPGCFSRCQ